MNQDDTWRLAELGQRAAELVHQLRQPLFTIRGFVQLAEKDPAAAAEHLSAARAQLDVLESLVNGWAELSRAPGATDVFFDARAPVEGAAVVLRHRAQSLGVHFDVASGRGWLVRGSPQALQQAVVNLGQNALDAIRGRDAASLTIRVEEELIVVEDNGPGLAPEVEARLFQPFLTTRAEGTGLGLSVARAMAARCGLSLELERARPGVRWVLRAG
ncbi:MAG: HAMP domain-containing histidine kinase [Deltaproteobacteria bacterium]|nr:HAMP domain-containing histidine kinase [Deltaproteobacteria bacterium]